MHHSDPLPSSPASIADLTALRRSAQPLGMVHGGSTPVLTDFLYLLFSRRFCGRGVQLSKLDDLCNFGRATVASAPDRAVCLMHAAWNSL